MWMMPPRSVLKLNPIPKEWGFLLCNIFIDMMNIEEFKQVMSYIVVGRVY